MGHDTSSFQGESSDPGTPGFELARVLADHAGDADRIVVAFSGGVDSTVLLHATAAGVPGRRLLAVHVHHGWHERADAWAHHCRQVAAALEIDCPVLRVDSSVVDGEGPEAAARRARHEALRDLIGHRDVLLTAHHADDQAETVLLALMRGGGVHGIAGMPVCRVFGRGLHLRPFLGIGGEDIRRWAVERGLAWIEDPANDDPAYDRVFLRQHVLPALRKRWPAAGSTLARTAALAADSIAVEDALAALDFVRCRGRVDGTLDASAVTGLPAQRQRILLRWWLRRQRLPVPPAARLETMRRQAASAAADRNPLIAWSGAEVRRWSGMLWALRPRAEIEPGAEFRWPAANETLELPGQRIERSALTRLGLEPGTHADVRVSFAQGGERVRLVGDARERALKDILREAGMPPWERQRVPLIHVDGRLAAVLGVGRVEADDDGG